MFKTIRTHNQRRLLPGEDGGLGAAIKLRRELDMGDIPRAQIAEDMGICDGYLHQIETGKILPSLTTLATICEVLNIDLWQLFYAASEIAKENR